MPGLSLEKALILFKQSLLKVLEDPQANPKLTAALAGILLIIVLLFLIFFILTYFATESFRRRRIMLERKEVLLKTTLIQLAIVSSLLLILIFIAGYQTSKPSFCKTCHIEKEQYATWRQSTHKEVKCLSCHSASGFPGSVTEKLKILRWTTIYLSRAYKLPLKAYVDNESCLTCHDKINKKTLISGLIRVSHKEFLSKGYLCTNCHNTVAHGEIVPVAKYPTMDKCLVCHRDKATSPNCKFCHVKDIGVSPRMRGPRRHFPKTQLGEVTSCQGCHPIEGCVRQCHGLELPHPPGWAKEGLHARYAAWDKKELCWRCHNGFPFCNKCHKFPGHAPEWKSEHAIAGSFTNQAGCRSCHRKRGPEADYCGLCH